MALNEVFREYTTSTAFMLQLSKMQCWGLLTVNDLSRDEWLHSGQFIILGKSLAARGLIRRAEKQPYWELTTAGELVVGLLKEAGLTKENTRTVSVIKGQQRWGIQLTGKG